MAPMVDVYRMRGHKRSNLVCDAVAAGLLECGVQFREKYESDFHVADGDVSIFYGFTSVMQRIMEGYSKPPRRAVYIDLGYWGRRAGGRFTGYHKVSVNARHPVRYYRKNQHGPERFEHHGELIQPWRGKGRSILLAGMGAKGARAEGMPAESWERWAIGELGKYTDRPIIYRPKPSWYEAKPLEGTVRLSRREELVSDLLADCHAVVTHHSNVAIEAVLAGVPAFCWGGVGKDMALQDLSRIEDPWFPEGRLEWASDIAWCQWSIEEFRRGAAWKYLLEEGLV